jgi:hypothetical protein
MTEPMRLWGVRLWLGALFLFGSEILLWIDVPSLTAGDWLLRAASYTLLAVLILDLAVRFRIRDVYDTMALLAIYALLAGLLVTPASSFVDFPRTLVTRVLGAHGLTGIEMFGWLLAFTAAGNSRINRLLLPAAAWNGFYWGTWMRWMPEFNPTFAAINLPQMLAAAGVAFGITHGIGWLATRWAATAPAHGFRLSPPGFLLLAAAGVALLALQLLRGFITGPVLVATVLLVLLAYAILWYRRETKEPMLLDAHFPAAPRSSLWALAAAAAFVAFTLIAYHLPLAGNDRINQLWLMEIGFGAVGVLWFPLCGVVLAFRSFDRQMRMNQL